MLILLTDDFTLDNLAAMLLEELVNLLKTLGFKEPGKLANCIKSSIQNSYHLKRMSQ